MRKVRLMTARRGTTNANVRGNSADRRRRREWLVREWRANVDLLRIDLAGGHWIEVPLGEGEPACRCYRCGGLLTADTVSPDRIDLGCDGGRYTRDNIRPACEGCQSHTGGKVGAQRKAAKAAAS